MEGHEDKKRKFEDGTEEQATLTSTEMRQLLEPFSKDQLIGLLTNAASRYADVAAEINAVASVDPAHRKLFVRGLAWETTTQKLTDAFLQYGEIEEGAVITDRATGKSRGFGFITFKHMDSAFKALREPTKKIDGRMTVCILAATGNTSQGAATTDTTQRKVYVGGLSYDTTSEALLAHFNQYGEIEEGSVAYDKASNKSRGFAFVTFKSSESARRAVQDTNKLIDGRQVVVKIASDNQRDREKSGPSGGQQGQMSYASPNANMTAGTMAGYRPQVAAPSSLGMPYGSGASLAYQPGQYASPQYTPGSLAQQYVSPQAAGAQVQTPGQQMQAPAQFGYVAGGQAYTPGSLSGMPGAVPMGMQNGQAGGQMFYPPSQ